MFQNVYRNRRVLITGHTGFKGSWLAHWLLRLGAEVTGVSIDVPTEPSHFARTGLAGLMDDRRMDIRDRTGITDLIRELQPDFVFHLAAQPLVWHSYTHPAETFEVNVQGTVNILEGLRLLDRPCTAVLITSDKCYENREWVWGYKETDRLGGKDPYSASKGAAELAIKGYHASFFSQNSPVRIATGRAGNVIGGGDWAPNRIVPDCIRAWVGKEAVEIRNPRATRPWQHVLEPLSGYLALGMRLLKDRNLAGEAFNFGPPPNQNHTVETLIRAMSDHWAGASFLLTAKENSPHEAGLLKLDCDKANWLLSWKPVLSFADTVRLTAEWYREEGGGKENMLPVTLAQIEIYERLALEGDLEWTRE